MARRGLIGWIAIASANATVLCTLIFAGTEWFIAHKRSTTLIYAPSARYHHSLLPDQHYRHGALAYSIGPHGLRGAMRVGKPRMVVVGGSSVFDFRVEPSWPERLGALNGGIPGYSLREVVPFYEDRIRPLSPEVVLIYVGWNDVKYISDSQVKLTLPDYPKSDGPPPAQYDFLLASRPKRNWLALPLMFDSLRHHTGAVRENTATKVRTSTGTVDWASTPGMAFFRERLNALLDRIEQDGARAIIVPEITLASADLPEADRKKIALSYVKLSYEELLRANEAVAAALCETATVRKLSCIDLRGELNGKPELFTDHVHLSERGSVRLAEALAPLLVQGADRDHRRDEETGAGDE
jgi:lysophospholipase L1-like esterase